MIDLMERERVKKMVQIEEKNAPIKKNNRVSLRNIKNKL